MIEVRTWPEWSDQWTQVELFHDDGQPTGQIYFEPRHMSPPFPPNTWLPVPRKV